MKNDIKILESFLEKKGLLQEYKEEVCRGFGTELEKYPHNANMIERFSRAQESLLVSSFMWDCSNRGYNWRSVDEEYKLSLL